MKFAVTKIEETRDTVVVEADTEEGAFAAAKEYDFNPIARHTVTQERYEVRPVQVVDEAANVHEGTETAQ